MNAEKPECMRVAKQFGQDYWDGDRKYGYGGYRNDGRWKTVAAKMAQHYGIKPTDRVIDIGCGKGFLISDIGLHTGCAIAGTDISLYAAEHSDLPVFLRSHCSVKMPFEDGHFDLAYSINVFHNLGFRDLKLAIKEMCRIGKRKYICVESYETEEQLCNLQMWALTAKGFYDKNDWLQIYEDCGYDGDVEFIVFD